MRMRTALAAAVLCSAALMGSAGIAAADDGDHSGDLMGVGNQHMHEQVAQDSDSWVFRSGGDEGGSENAGGDHAGGDHAKGKGGGGSHGK
ncbi:hypothetical protein [Streptomyces sp. YGL11-2]|uniref:hypothetical protein n=1 Tax=Streptomyces sp. YGL11-2 TaxID=3414028 RepID=UPI003CF52955